MLVQRTEEEVYLFDLISTYVYLFDDLFDINPCVCYKMTSGGCDLIWFKFSK
jgi:hypothetical protein